MGARGTAARNSRAPCARRTLSRAATSVSEPHTHSDFDELDVQNTDNMLPTVPLALVLVLSLVAVRCGAQPAPPVPPGVNESNCRGCLDPVAGICILNLDAQHGSTDCAPVGPQDCAQNGLIWVNNTINQFPSGDGCLAIPEAMGSNCSYLIGPVSCVFGE